MTAKKYPSDDELIAIAKKYSERAYAPYSKFKVGAALLAKSGKVYGGCNVENAAYPVGICAERVALGSAVAGGERDFIAIAVVAESPAPCSPCGMCRQALAEFPPERIIMANLSGEVIVLTPAELLPHIFSL